MTLPEFLEKLEQTPRDWKRWKDKSLIRRGDGPDAGAVQCPVSSMAGSCAYNYLDVAAEYGLPEKLARDIAAAADAWEHHDAELRAKLLKACGLEAR